MDFMNILFDDKGKPRKLIDIEREQLKILWRKCRGNVNEIAKIMGCTRKQVYLRLKKTGLRSPVYGNFGNKNSTGFKRSEENKRKISEGMKRSISANQAKKINKRVVEAHEKVYDNALVE